MRDEKEKAFKPMRICAFLSSEAARLMSRGSWSRVAPYMFYLSYMVKMNRENSVNPVNYVSEKNGIALFVLDT